MDNLIKVYTYIPAKKAEKIANNMKDEYVSVEHIMLGIIDKANRELANLLKTFNITKSKFLKR